MTDILTTINNLGSSATITIGVVIGVVILIAFIIHWARGHFSITSLIVGGLTAAAAGWISSAGIGWLSSGIGGTIENNSASGALDTIATLTTLL